MKLEGILQDPIAKRLFIVCLAVSGGTLIAFLFHFILMGYFLKYDYPYNTFLFFPRDRFADFYNQLRIAANRDPFVLDGVPEGWLRTYFPFSYLVLWFLSIFHKRPALAFVSIAFVWSFIGIIHWFFLKVKRTSLSSANFTITKHLITITVLLSYPVIFTLDRGNLEMLAIVPTMLAVILMERNNASKRDFLVSSLLLAVATSIKLFPVVFAILLLKKKRCREFASVFIFSILLNVVSLLLFKSPVGLSLQGMMAGKRHFMETYILSSSGVSGGGLAYSSSILNVIKIMSINNDLSACVCFYSIAAFILGVFIAYLVIFRKTSYLHSVYLLTSIVIILPHMSGDYRLTYIFIPLLYLIALEKKYGFVEWSMLITILLLLIPKHYYFFFECTSISVIINPLLIVFSIVVVIIASIKGQNQYGEKSVYYLPE